MASRSGMWPAKPVTKIILSFDLFGQVQAPTRDMYTEVGAGISTGMGAGISKGKSDSASVSLSAGEGRGIGHPVTFFEELIYNGISGWTLANFPDTEAENLP